MTDPILVALARALPDFIDGKPTSGGFGKETTAKRMHDALAAEGLVLVSAKRLAKLEGVAQAAMWWRLVDPYGPHGSESVNELTNALAAPDEEERR